MITPDIKLLDHEGLFAQLCNELVQQKSLTLHLYIQKVEK